MGLFSRENAQQLKKRVISGTGERGQRIAGGLWHQFNELHSVDFYEDRGIEELLLQQKKHDLETMDFYKTLPKDVIVFSPSGAYKCGRELYFKANKEEKDEIVRYPYQRRWTRNSSAVHEAVQRDLLYSEVVLANPLFTVARDEKTGLPCWEQNIKTVKRFLHNGVEFGVYGMMDGILEYAADGSKIGFEFKTKSTTIGTVGHYKMKDAQAEHKVQCTAYSLLFGVEEFVLMYESVAKDGWTKGAEAKPDMRTFYHKVTKEDKVALLDRWAAIAKQYYAESVPGREPDKCFFCPYVSACNGVEGVSE